MRATTTSATASAATDHECGCRPRPHGKSTLSGVSSAGLHSERLGIQGLEPSGAGGASPPGQRATTCVRTPSTPGTSAVLENSWLPIPANRVCGDWTNFELGVVALRGVRPGDETAEAVEDPEHEVRAVLAYAGEDRERLLERRRR